jgi:7,8-dihydroneopterin aldolase/epimerase/oxygenase
VAKVKGKRKPKPAAAAASGPSRVFVQNLVLPAMIGIHPHEREMAQRVRFAVDLAVAQGPAPADISEVVSYEDVVLGIKRILSAGHVDLVETLADGIAEFCLADPRVITARIRVEKLDVFPDAESVGVEIVRAGKRKSRA